MKNLRERVDRVAQAILARQGFVTPLDVMIDLGWMSSNAVAEWRRGRHESLAFWNQINPAKVADMHEMLRRWADTTGLVAQPHEPIVRRPPNTYPLGILGTSPEQDEPFRVRYAPPGAEPAPPKPAAKPEMVAYCVVGDSQCDGCQTEIPKGGFLMMVDGHPRCLECVGFGHLVFLGTGDAKLTRRASKYSSTRIVVVRMARARGRYERQGLLVEPEAVERAEAECEQELRKEQAKPERRRKQ